MKTIKVVKGDITTLKVDAIVNAAKESLLGGGGVDGAIHKAAGPKLLEACEKLGGCLTGFAKLTPGFDLPAQYVIHTPGPFYLDGKHGEPDDLYNCYYSCFEIAINKKLKSIALPAISTGIYGYPVGEATLIAVKEAYETEYDGEIIFCGFDEAMVNIYEDALQMLKPIGY